MNNQYNNYYQPQNPNQYNYYQTPPQKNKKSKGFLIGLIVIGILAFFMILAGVLAFIFFKDDISAKINQLTQGRLNQSNDANLLHAYIDDNNKGYFLKEKGEIVEVVSDNELLGAVMTEDRQNIFVIEKDGMRILDHKGTTITGFPCQEDEEIELYTMNDQLAVFTVHKSNDEYESSEKICVCGYSNGLRESIMETNVYQVKVLDDNLIFFMSEDGLFKYDISISSLTKLADVTENECEFLYISNDGEEVVWMEKSDVSESDDCDAYVYGYKEGKVTELGYWDSLSIDGNVMAIKIKKTDKFLIYSYDGDYMLYTDINGSDNRKLQLSGNLSSGLYNSSAYIEPGQEIDTKAIYLVCSEGGLLYYNIADDKLENVNADIYSIVSIHGGKILAFNNRGDFIKASLKKNILKNSQLIDSNLCAIPRECNRGKTGAFFKNMYYLKSTNNNQSFGLYYWNGKKSEMIKADICECNLYLYGEKAVVCLADEVYDEDMGDSATVYLAQGDRVKPVESGISMVEFFTEDKDRKEFSMLRYVGGDDEYDYVDVIYYDGKESKTVLTNVRFDGN